MPKPQGFCLPAHVKPSDSALACAKRVGKYEYRRRVHVQRVSGMKHPNQGQYSRVGFPEVTTKRPNTENIQKTDRYDAIGKQTESTEINKRWVVT